jgi:two-component system phosphate regulon sensor histidine kinase PhoR
MRFLSIMADQGRRMARLVDDLLSLSRIELNEHVRPQASVDLVSTARRIVDALEPVAREAGVSLQINAPERAIVRGDADELARLTENLVENAIKYGAAGQAEPRVEITIAVGVAGATLAVSDNGPGIAAEHLPRLTERFYRVDTATSRAKGGTGLGLAIVKHIALRHRARLSIESRPGEGARFTIAFPAEKFETNSIS